jgi:cytochrome c oxidase subunit I+III
MIAGLLLLGGGFALHVLAVGGIGPKANGYGATVYALLAWQGAHVLLVAIMGAYTLARRYAGLLDAARRVTYENTWLMWLFTALQGIATLAVIHSPRLGGS